MAEASFPRKLRVLTHLCPGLPIELFQMYQSYLEEKLSCDSSLMLESRAEQLHSDKPDPFTLDEVDLGFVNSGFYLQAAEQSNPHIELLPVAPIHMHQKSENRPVFFSEVIVCISKTEKKYKKFGDLKGHRWAYSNEDSLSGNLITLAELKRQGYNASFFGHIIHSGSDRHSIEMVLSGTVDAAAIDSTVLHHYLADHTESKSLLHILTSWGPLPVPPILINSRVQGNMKMKIAQALLDMNKDEKWQKELAKFNLWGFKQIDSSIYDDEKEMRELVKENKIVTTYY